MFVVIVQDLPIKELNTSITNNRSPILMGELKPRIMNLLINALQHETDSHNSQMLLGIVIFSIFSFIEYFSL